AVLLVAASLATPPMGMADASEKSTTFTLRYWPALPSPEEEEEGNGAEPCQPVIEPGSGRTLRIRGPADNPDPNIARARSQREATLFDAFGPPGDTSWTDPNTPLVPWGRDDAMGTDGHTSSAAGSGSISFPVMSCWAAPTPTWICSGDTPPPPT